MKLRLLAIPALTIALVAPAGWMTAHAAPAAAGFAQDRHWDEAPGEYREAQRQGFHDGIEAARRDFQGRHHKDMDDHAAYKHPRVERDLRDQYREGFKSGYETAQRHMMDEHRDRDHDHDAHPY